MKRILLLLVAFISITAFSQTQTFSKPPKFKSVIQNNVNTKVLTINSSDVLQFRAFDSFIPTLDRVLQSGDTSAQPIFLDAKSTSPFLGFMQIFENRLVNQKNLLLKPNKIVFTPLNSSNNGTLTFPNSGTGAVDWNLPSQSGTLALAVQGNYATADGNITIPNLITGGGGVNSIPRFNSNGQLESSLISENNSEVYISGNTEVDGAGTFNGNFRAIIPVYESHQEADSDVNLLTGQFYKIENGRSVYQKP